jgi:hypothetical protein
MPFRGFVDVQTHSELEFPKTSKISSQKALISSQNENVKKFMNVKRKTKHVNRPLSKIRVAKSNSDVISSLPRPLIAETISGLKILKNSQTVAD